MKEKKEGIFLPVLIATLAASLVQPVISSVVKCICGRAVIKRESGYLNKNV